MSGVARSGSVLASFPLVAAALGACLAPDPVVYLPTYRPLDAMPAGLIEGVLVEADGCLWIETDGQRLLVLWPRDSTVTSTVDGLAVGAEGVTIPVGTPMRAGGGQYQQEHQAFVHDLIGEPVPEACRSTGLYWLAGGIEPAEP